jgi:hypothetical protein
VTHRILAQHTVVEIEKGFAITRTASHIRLKDGKPHFGHKIVQSAQETARRLRLWSTADAYEHGKSRQVLSGGGWGCCFGLVCDGADDTAVERGNRMMLCSEKLSISMPGWCSVCRGHGLGLECCVKPDANYRSIVSFAASVLSVHHNNSSVPLRTHSHASAR